MAGEDAYAWQKARNFTSYDLNDKVSYRIGTSSGRLYTSAGSTDQSFKVGFGSSSRIMSRENRLWKHFRGVPDNHALRALDMGGDFALEQVHLSVPPSFRIHYRASSTSGREVNGFVSPSREFETMAMSLSNGTFPGIPSTLGTSRSNLIALGSTAIARSLPNVPPFSAPRFLGELAQGLPAIPGKALKKSRSLRNAGGEYLNFQFGVAPTLNDLGPFIEYLAGIKKAIRQTHFGETARVRKVIDKGISTTRVPYTSSDYSVRTVNGTYTSTIAGSGYLSTRSEYRIWSSITFVYDQVRLLDQMISDFEDWLGLKNIVPTAVDVYNLVPYTWLVDWFANFNHVVTNLSYIGRDGLYLRYGYIMATYKDTLTYEMSKRVGDIPLHTTANATFVRKYRVKASPFGFGLTFKDLDGFQTSILAAIGVSKLRF
jgi:hypothetical protein